MKNKTLLLFFFFSSIAFSQSKQDIIDYLKTTIELYSERPTSIEVTSCGLEISTLMNIPGSATYTTKVSCPMKELLDVMYVNDKQVWITLKFRSKNVSYTDIENNDSEKFWKLDNKANLFFSKGTLNDEQAKKVVELLKKLGEICGAKVLKL